MKIRHISEFLIRFVLKPWITGRPDNLRLLKGQNASYFVRPDAKSNEVPFQ